MSDKTKDEREAEGYADKANENWWCNDCDVTVVAQAAFLAACKMKDEEIEKAVRLAIKIAEEMGSECFESLSKKQIEEIVEKVCGGKK